MSINIMGSLEGARCAACKKADGSVATLSIGSALVCICLPCARSLRDTLDGALGDVVGLDRAQKKPATRTGS